ncbi:unnamed protein product [Ectocarpus sp. 13 AM-2016]
MKSHTTDDTRTIGEAWTQATRLSACGLLHEATLSFLRLRVILHNEKSKLRRFEPGGKSKKQHATQGMEEAQAMSRSNRASAKATCVVDKLLSKNPSRVFLSWWRVSGGTRTPIAPAFFEEQPLRGVTVASSLAC